MRIALAVALLIVFSAGCEGQPEQQAPPSDAPDTTATPLEPSPSGELGVSLQTLLDNAFERHPDTQQLPILDRLNEPLRVSIDTQRNIHRPSQTDTLRTRHYDGLQLTVYNVAGGKEILKSVTVTGSDYESPDGVSVGMSRSDVESALGAADDQQDGADVYIGDGPMPTRFYVHYQNGSVSSYEWHYPID